MRIATEAEYNADTRMIEFKLDVYFEGRDNDPTTIDGDGFVDLSFLDEACADGTTPIGTPSSNEVSITLASINGLWNPTNVNSPYYGKMNLGVPADLYIRPYVDAEEEVTHGSLLQTTHGQLATMTHEEIESYSSEEYEWQPLGQFQVTSWSSSITGITAEVVLNDKMYQLLGTEITKLPVVAKPTMGEFIDSFFKKNGLSYVIDGSLDQRLLYSYNVADNSNFLKEISFAAFSFIFMNHDGKIVIKELEHISSVDWEIGEEQIIDITSKQTAEYKYLGVSFTAEQPQVGDLQELIKYVDQPIGAQEIIRYDNRELKGAPIYAIASSEVDSDVDCLVTDLSADVKDISYKVTNRSNKEGTFTSIISGYPLVTNNLILDDGVSDELKVNSIYVQTELEANRIKTLLTNYVSLHVPTLELNIRGNPLITPGDRVRVYSENFNIDYTGWVIRQNFRYDGTLSASLTILSSNVIGG